MPCIRTFMKQFDDDCTLIDTIELYILISVWMTLTCFKFTGVQKSQLSHKVSIDWMEFGLLFRFSGGLSLVLMLSHPFNIQGWEPSLKFKCWFAGNSVCYHNLLVCWSSCWIYFAQVTFKGENCAEWFYEMDVQHHVSGHLWANLFETWYDAKHCKTLWFDSSLNDLDIHSRP